MRNRTKLAAYPLALCLLVALCGCSARGPSSPAETKPAEGAVISLETRGPDARSAALFGEDFWAQEGLRTLDEIASLSTTVSGGQAYQLMRDGDIYRYDPLADRYSLFARVPPVPSGRYGEDAEYSDLPAEVRAQAEEAVFQLLGSSDGLWGYCSVNGRIGRIDENGVHWNEVALDNALHRELSAGGGAFPSHLFCDFMEDGFLYALADQTGLNFGGEGALPQGLLMRFDMATGACRATELGGVYMLCPYTPGRLLLLERGEDGRLLLRDFDPETGKRLALSIEAPADGDPANRGDWLSVVSRVSGLAYDREGDRVYLATERGLWRSVAGRPFEPVPLQGETWTDGIDMNPYARAWALPGGYWLRNGSSYLVSLP